LADMKAYCPFVFKCW